MSSEIVSDFFYLGNEMLKMIDFMLLDEPSPQLMRGFLFSACKRMYRFVLILLLMSAYVGKNYFQLFSLF